MYDLLAKALDALAGYPIIQAAVAILVLIAGVVFIRRGERDRKANGNGNGDATPRWFANEQTLELLREIKTELHHQSGLLEQIANENMINPRRIQE